MITEINAQVNLGYKTTNLTIKQVGRVNLLHGKDAARLYSQLDEDCAIWCGLLVFFGLSAYSFFT